MSAGPEATPTVDTMCRTPTCAASTASAPARSASPSDTRFSLLRASTASPHSSAADTATTSPASTHSASFDDVSVPPCISTPHGFPGSSHSP